MDPLRSDGKRIYDEHERLLSVNTWYSIEQPGSESPLLICNPLSYEKNILFIIHIRQPTYNS